MTYNIRYDTAKDGENAWPNRRPYVSQIIQYFSPDILGLQEVLAHQLDQLQYDLPNYSTIGVGRDDGKSGGEFTPLFIKQGKFKIHESGTFWLSEEPNIPSTGWDAALPRTATWARVTENSSQNTYLIVNTHWDHRGEIARQRSALLIRNWMQENVGPDETPILMGDLNTTPSTEAIITLRDSDFLTDARKVSQIPPLGPPGTSNGFEIYHSEEEPIDFVFLGATSEVVRYAVITQHHEGRLPSDHYPIIVDIEQ